MKMSDINRLYLHSEIMRPIPEGYPKFLPDDERIPPDNDGTARSVAFLATQVAVEHFPRPLFFREKPEIPNWVSSLAHEIAFKATQVAVANWIPGELIPPL